MTMILSKKFCSKYQDGGGYNNTFYCIGTMFVWPDYLFDHVYQPFRCYIDNDLISII